MSPNEPLNLGHIAIVYEIMCQACETLRQDNMTPMLLGKGGNHGARGNNQKNKGQGSRSKEKSSKTQLQNKQHQGHSVNKGSSQGKRNQNDNVASKIKEEARKLQQEVI